MDPITTFTTRDTIRPLNQKEILVGTVVMRSCMNVQPTEKVLVVTDSSKRNVEAAILFEAAKTVADEVTLLSFDGMTSNAQEPPEQIRAAMVGADVVFLVTSYSLSHTAARLDACRRGARIASMPGITKNMMMRALDIDYESLGKLSRRLARILSNGSRVTLTSPAGTRLQLTIAKRQGIADSGVFKKPGDFGNLPAGEAFIAPQESETNGVVVFDGAVANIELDKPISIQIRQGIIQTIMGGKAAKIFEQTIDAAGKQARIACEFGIGTNPAARLSPQILEAEKVYGTCHVAFGKNNTFGGVVDVLFHTDGLIKNPTLIVDGVTIVNQGRIL